MSRKLLRALFGAAVLGLASTAYSVGASMQVLAHTGHDDHGFAAGEPGDAKQSFRTVDIVMTDGPGTMAYAPNRIEVRKGEQIKFVLKNTGQVDHEFLLELVQEQCQAQAGNGKERGDGA